MSKQGLVKITKLPEDLKSFKGTICCYNGEWYAPADSEIARINGVGVEKKEDGDEKDWAIVVTLGKLSKPRGIENAIHKSYYIESCSREEAIGKVVDSVLSEKNDWYLLGIKTAIIE